MTIQKPEEFVRVLSGFYNRDWLTWDQPILEATLAKNFNYAPTEEENDQIEAVRELLRGDRAFTDPLLFEDIILALNGQPILFDTWQRCEPHEIAYGVYLIERITGRKDFDRPVRSYIAAALFHEDLHVAPTTLHLDAGRAFLRSLSKITDSEVAQLETIVDQLIAAKGVEAMAKVVKNAPDSEGDFLRGQAAALGEIVQYLKDRGAL